MVQYQALDPGDAQIRVFTLTHLAAGDPISLSLRRLSIKRHAQYYSALSYCWGDPADKEDITVDGHTVQVPRNLADALRHIGLGLVPSKDKLTVWADSICIDQGNVAERNHQVQMMRDIYKNARRTISWLGRGSPDEHEAWDIIKRVSGKIGDRTQEDAGLPGLEVLEDFPELSQADETQGNSSWAGVTDKSPWKKIERIWQNPYWSRVWVIQEIVLSQETVLYLGDTIMGWLTLVQFITWLNVVRKEDADPEMMSLIYPDLNISSSIKGYLASVVADHFSNLQAIAWLRFRVEEAEQLAMHYMTPYLTFEASDPKDKIYALLGIFQLDITVDYTKTVRQIYLEFANEWLRNVGGLGLLAFAGRGLLEHMPDSFQLPSWVPDWHRITRGGISETNPDDTHQRRTENLAVQHRASPRITGDVLAFCGHRFDSVSRTFGDPPGASDETSVRDVADSNTELGRRNALEVSPAEKYHKWKAEGALKFPGGMPFLRAMFSIYAHGIRDENNSTVTPGSPWFYRLTCAFLNHLVFRQRDYLNSEHKSIHGWITSGLEENGMTNDEYFCDTLKEEFLGHIPVPEDWLGLSCTEVFHLQSTHLFQDYETLMRQIDAAHQGKCMFETNKGYVAVGPIWTRPDDIVVLVPGLSSSVLLRHEGDHYVHVGLCYLAGAEPQKHLVDHTDWLIMEEFRLK